MVRHQEGAPIGTDDLDGIADLEVTHVVGSHASDCRSGVIVSNAFYGERDVVVVRTFAIAWTRHGVQTHIVRLAIRVDSGRDDPDALTLEHRECGGAKIE